MIAALTIAAVALFIVLVLMWAMQHCLACDPDADPMEATAGVHISKAEAEEMDAMAAYAEASNPKPLLELRTHRVVHPGAPELDAAIKRRVLIGCGFVLAMICLSAWVGAR